MEGGPEFKDSLSHIARGRKNKGKKERKRGGREEKGPYVAEAPPNSGKGASISRTLYVSDMPLQSQPRDCLSLRKQQTLGEVKELALGRGRGKLGILASGMGASDLELSAWQVLLSLFPAASQPTKYTTSPSY